ncbi:MAG: hypothetical protein LBQ38_03450 [Spirochaetaceae bacterium]|jgi:hypothetical protein|nr:hypothetical protein [Spirochaetaceae bacterium]
MKTTNKWLFGLLALGFVLAGCEGVADGKLVDLNLHGTWESTDTSLYSGTLVIGYDTITITGYYESQTIDFWKDVQRPFKGFAKNVPLPCYTEDKKLFIEMVGGGESILPYTYYYNTQGKFLRFSFGDSTAGYREEALKRIGD